MLLSSLMDKSGPVTASLRSCPDCIKSWQLRGEFLHLYGRDAHKANAATTATRRSIKFELRYTTSPVGHHISGRQNIQRSIFGSVHLKMRLVIS